MVTKIYDKIRYKFSVSTFKKKVPLVFENGQKKMSKIEKPKKVLKKTLVVEVSYQNAHKTEKITQKSVTIKFLYFTKII
jgi:hypothetical protein